MSRTTHPLGFDLKDLYNSDLSSVYDWIKTIDKSLDSYQKFPTDLVKVQTSGTQTTDNIYKLYIEIPGVDKKDILLTVDGNKILIGIEKKCPYSNTVELNQRCFGKFTKTINLSFNPDPKHIKAIYTDGILTIELTESNQSQNIQIN
jgi:HSP20 family molecular chaperone IbpA